MVDLSFTTDCSTFAQSLIIRKMEGFLTRASVFIIERRFSKILFAVTMNYFLSLRRSKMIWLIFMPS